MNVELVPFAQTKATEVIKLSVDFKIEAGACLFKFLVLGPVEKLAVPAISPAPTRKEGLWNRTCFEVFISREGSTKYLEWNFSPTHDWCRLSFDDYRVPSKDPIKNHDAPKIISRRGKKEFSLDAHFSLEPYEAFWGASSKYEVGLGVVVEHQNGDRSFWAPSHLATHPDFHLRKSLNHGT